MASPLLAGGVLAFVLACSSLQSSSAVMTRRRRHHQTLTMELSTQASLDASAYAESPFHGHTLTHTTSSSSAAPAAAGRTLRPGEGAAFDISAKCRAPLSAEAAKALGVPAGSWHPSCRHLMRETPETALRRVKLARYEDKWASPETAAERARRPSPRLIPCPVLAAMYTGGALKPDAEGKVSMYHVREMMKEGIGAKQTMATTIARGAVVYAEDDTENVVKAPVFSGNAAESGRYINLFKLNRNFHRQHGYSTTSRDLKATNSDDALTMEQRFDKWYKPHFEADGRCGARCIGSIIANAEKVGERGGEMSLAKDRGWKGWGMKFAMAGWLAAFGERDPVTGLMHFTEDQAKDMIIRSTYPAAWKRRPWGWPEEVATIKAFDIRDKGNLFGGGGLFRRGAYQGLPLGFFGSGVLDGGLKLVYRSALKNVVYEYQCHASCRTCKGLGADECKMCRDGLTLRRRKKTFLFGVVRWGKDEVGTCASRTSEEAS